MTGCNNPHDPAHVFRDWEHWHTRAGHDRSHFPKTWPESFSAVNKRYKRFEYRKNDRDFRPGDLLFLLRYDLADGYNGEFFVARVSYVLYGGKYDLPEGYCIMGLENGIDPRSSYDDPFFRQSHVG